ncbi:MAG: hypothetical protein WAV95_00245 [Azonexus sp.]
MTASDPVNAVVPGWWQQLLSTQRREIRRILAEVLVMRGMMPLLMKARNGGHWTPEEKEQIVGHLRRMAHLSPYLLVLMLPGSVFLLPAYAWWLDRRRLNRQD